MFFPEFVRSFLEDPTVYNCFIQWFCWLQETPTSITIDLGALYKAGLHARTSLRNIQSRLWNLLQRLNLSIIEKRFAFFIGNIFSISFDQIRHLWGTVSNIYRASCARWWALRSALPRSMVPSTLRRGAWWLMAFRDLFESRLMRYPACKLEKLFGITSHLQVSTLESSSAQYILYFQPSCVPCKLSSFQLMAFWNGFYRVIPIPIWNISINTQEFHLGSPQATALPISRGYAAWLRGKESLLHRDGRGTRRLGLPDGGIPVAAERPAIELYIDIIRLNII